MIKLLAKYGADMSKSESYSSPMFEAARKMLYSTNEERKNYLADCIKYLLSYDQNLVDEKGISILYYAVVAENIPLIKHLVVNEEELVNLPGDNGQTVLFEAVKNNSYEVVRLLVENGADKNILDNTGHKAYDYAVEKGYDNITSFLNQNSETNN